MKLQQAYISEAATAIGNYKIIGYSTPGQDSKTTNFDYTELAANAAWTNNTTALSTTAVTGWQAKSNVKLNDCDAQSTWTVTVVGSTSMAGEATFTANLPTDTDCMALTPTFDKIGK